MRLPSLSASRRLRLSSFTLFYVAQGLPMGLITVALPAWLAASGADRSAVASFVAAALLPWAFKLFAGPLMDRFRLPSLGNRRPWVMLAQTGLLAALATLMIVGPGPSELGLLTACCIGISSFAAVQDVAVDGMAIDVLPETERGRANALMAFGQVAGIAVSGAGCGWALANVGVAFTAAVLACCIGLILAVVVLFRERDGEKLLPWTAGAARQRDGMQVVSWAGIAVNLFRVLILPASLLLLAVTLFWRIGHGMFIAAAPILLTQELGWDSVSSSSWISASQFVAALAGIAIGPFIDRNGARVFLARGLVFGGLVFLAMWLATPWWEHRLTWIIGLFAMKFAVQVLFVAYIALHMNICWNKVAATQFAIYMAWANLAYSMGAEAYSQIAPVVAIGQESLVIAGLFAVALILLAFVDLGRHRERLGALRPAVPSSDPLADVPGSG